MSKDLISALYKNAKYNAQEAESGKESEREAHEIFRAVFMTVATTLENKMLQYPTFVPSSDLSAAVAATFSRILPNAAAANATMASLTGHRPCVTPVASGTTRNVSTKAEFDTAYAASASGDGIVISASTHNWGVVTMAGSAQVLVTGVGATFNGTTKWNITGSNVTMFGIRMVGSNARFQFETQSTSANCKFLCCEIDSPVSSGNSYDVGIFNRGNFVEVADCLIHNTPKLFFGVFMGGSTSGPESTDGHVHHNTFRDSFSNGANGGCALRIGLSGFDNRTLTEYNHFDNWNDDAETIEMKGSDCLFQYNYFTDCDFGHISCRWGNNNVFYANFNDGARWLLRFNGTGNKAYFNYGKARATGFEEAFMFFHTDSNPNVNARNVGAFNNIARYNISEGFGNWAGTLAQGTAPFTYTAGNVVSDNYFLGTGSVGGQTNFEIDMQTWAEYDATNTHENNVNFTLDAATGEYVVPSPIPNVLSVDGYDQPSWWSEMVA